MRVCVGVMMWATDMRASRFESGLAGAGAVSVDHEYRRGVTDGGGDGAKSGVICAGGVDGRTGREGTARKTRSCSGDGEGERDGSSG